MAKKTLSEQIQTELFEIRDFDVVLLSRVSVLTLIGTRRVLENKRAWWLEKLLTVSQFKKSLMNALPTSKLRILSMAVDVGRDTDRQVGLRKS